MWCDQVPSRLNVFLYNNSTYILVNVLFKIVCWGFTQWPQQLCHCLNHCV